MERILASPGFRASKKYPALFRYLVEETLEGRADHLKERSVGVAVFGRPPDYDTASDPVVRITAGEVRKRIGQYYHEWATQREVIIDLPAGSYVPRFRHAEAVLDPGAVLETASVAAPLDIVELDLVEPPARPSPPLERLRKIRISRRQVVAFAVLALIGSAGLSWRLLARTAIDRFWGPVLNGSGVVLISVAGGYAPGVRPADAQQVPGPGSNRAPNSVSISDFQHGDRMGFGDAMSMAHVTGLLTSRGKGYLIVPRTSMQLAQMRTAPAVLIGAFNNPWTLKLTANLRFSFQRDSPASTNWIQDRKNPNKREWMVTDTTPYTNVFEDWAVISRFWDATTEHMVITVAGLSRWGTVAAGEFVTDPAKMEELAQLAPAGWERKNMQAVIATRVINGQSGPPKILATEFW